MSLIAETSNHLLEQALVAKLQRRAQSMGGMGELAPVAVRLGLVQNSMKPRFSEPQLVLFAADHGLAVEGIHTAQSQSTDEQVQQILAGHLPVAVFARQMGLALSLVDCGTATPLPTHERLLQRKIAHGTRNARVGSAMSLEHAHAAIRAGMEIGDSMHGNMVACAGIGLGSHEAAALVLSRLTEAPVRELLVSGPGMNPDVLAHLLVVAQSALARHRDTHDPVEVLAAFGGFETAVMVGVMLVAASKRHLIMVDGIAACAALMVASRISPAVTDYAVFCRSQSHLGLDHALSLFHATSMLELGLDTTDGSGACLSWPLVRAAAALMSDGPEMADGEDSGLQGLQAAGGPLVDSGAATQPGVHNAAAPTQPNPGDLA